MPAFPRLRLALGLLGAVAGCTLVNAPKPPPDASPGDAGIDAPTDARTDADAPIGEVCDNAADDNGDGLVDCDDPSCEGRVCGDGCTCRGGRKTETSCSDGTDDDGDGLVDCDDFDCASEPTVDCCGETVTPPATWPNERSTWPRAQSALEAEWQTTSATGALPVREAGTHLTEFADTAPFALVHYTCLSLALGASFEASFTPRAQEPDHGCAESGRCESFAALVLSPVREALPGRRLLDDLAVVFYPGGRVEVTQGGTALASAELSNVETEYRASVELTPDVDPVGRAALRAEVRVSRPGMDPELSWDGYPLLQEQLIDDGSCANLPGLYLAFEGFGDGVTVGQLHEATPRACVNPNQFTQTEAILTADGAGGTASLRFSPPSMGPEWADEAIGSPSLFVRDSNWHVMVEATNDQPELELVAHVGYALGHARALGWPRDEWLAGAQLPRLGDQPPSCLDRSCTTPPTQSYRDPHLFEKAGALFVAVAAEVFEGATPTGHHSLHIGATVTSEEQRITLGDALLTPDTAGCEDLRDPVVVPRPGGAPNVDYWLFYTCVRPAGSSIDAVPLVDIAGWRMPEGAEPVTVLAPDEVGSFGAGGVRSPALVVDAAPGEPATFRLWFLGQSRAGATAVGLALGAPKDAFPGDEARATTPDRPVLEPYRANPVLRSADRGFRGCEGCTIEGLGVTRVDDAVLRFLVARRVPLSTGRRYELVPFDQPWRP